MQNKRVTILLLTAVVVIWGILFYKIYMTVYSSGNAPLYAPSQKFKRQEPRKRYELKLLARDPFLSILTDTITEPIPIPVFKPKPPEINEIDMPIFCGIIKSNKKNMAILKKDKKVFFAYEGDMIKSIKIKKITTDSMVTMVNGNVSIIYLSHKK
jgi:hypothetical protein